MFGLALVLFLVTALGGITAGTLHLRNTPPPAWLGRIHGTAALAAIVVLALGVGQHLDDWTQASWAATSLAGFLVTAVIGRALFSFHVRTGTVPKTAIFVHAAAAVSSLLLLVAEVATQ